MQWGSHGPNEPVGICTDIFFAMPFGLLDFSELIILFDYNSSRARERRERRHKGTHVGHWAKQFDHHVSPPFLWPKRL